MHTLFAKPFLDKLSHKYVNLCKNGFYELFTQIFILLMEVCLNTSLNTWTILVTINKETVLTQCVLFELGMQTNFLGLHAAQAEQISVNHSQNHC